MRGSAVGTPFEQTTTATGTQNDFSLSARHTHLRCNNGSALTFTGFTINGSAPVGGEVVIIDNIGTSTVRVAHQDTGSTAASRAIGTSTRGQILGAGGKLMLVYDITTARWRMALLDAGAAITVPFSAGDYTAAGSMVWTVDSGDVGVHTYVQRGKFVTLGITLDTSTTSGTASTVVLIALPNGFTVSTAQVLPFGRYYDGSWKAACGGALPAITTTSWAIFELTAATFGLVTNNFYVQGTVTVEVD